MKNACECHGTFYTRLEHRLGKTFLTSSHHSDSCRTCTLNLVVSETVSKPGKWRDKKSSYQLLFTVPKITLFRSFYK